MVSFQERLKELREKRGLSQDQLADILGIPRSSIAHYESAEKDRLPRPDRMRKIADFFGVTTDYLLGRTEDPRGYAAADDVADDLSHEERRLLESIRELPPEKQQEVVDFVDFLKFRNDKSEHDEESATVEYDEKIFTSLGLPEEYLNEIPLEERPAFLAWVSDNLQGVFFYDFDQDREESKRAVMDSLKILWDQAKRRKQKREW